MPRTPPDYVLNPHARLTARGDDARVDWSVEAAVRGEGVRQSVVEWGTLPAVERLFTSLLDGPASAAMTVDDATAEALVRLGVLVTAAEVPRDVVFSARLDEPLWRPEPVAGPLCLNRRVRLAPTADGPGLFRPGTIVTVVDPERDLELPYWLEPRQEAAVHDLLAGRLAVADLDRSTADAFVGAGILYDPAAVQAARRGRARAIDEARGQVAARGLCRIDDLLPALFVAALRRYFRGLVAEGHLSLGDVQVPQRYVGHNEPLSSWLHERLTGPVGALVPEPVRRSYSYVVAYLEGASLASHRDRDQCAYTLSLAIDATPDASREGAWPLLVESAPGGPKVDLLLRPGDAALFRGQQLAHERGPLPPGRTAACILLHFVTDDFDGPLD